jgi:hypothetical protein
MDGCKYMALSMLRRFPHTGTGEHHPIIGHFKLDAAVGSFLCGAHKNFLTCGPRQTWTSAGPLHTPDLYFYLEIVTL